MIDLIHAKKVFKEYLKDYDTESEDIKLKIVHTYGVMEKSEYISKKLNLNEEEIQLAELIALLHDIGRFEQRKSLKEFEDFKGLDHAEYAIEISYLAFIFDLNFKVSLQYIEDNNYINRLIDRLQYKNDDTKRKMEVIRKCANEYVKERIENV